MLKEKADVVVEDFSVTPWWRCSEVGACETLLCHKKLGHEALPMPGRIRRLLDDGKAHERDIIERFVSSGVNVKYSGSNQVEVTVSKKPHCIGHPDGLLDLPKDYPRGLDRWDDGFAFDLRYYLLEITAPNHFSFQRVRSQGMREALWQKYLQVQRYLSSEAIREYTNCCVVVVKNKNTSELYEEGVSLDLVVVEQNNEVLLRLEEFIAAETVPDFRCDDWRRNICSYRSLCFGVSPEATAFVGALVGEELAEAAELLNAVEQWKKGKEYEDYAKELVEDAREYFRSVLKEYGKQRLSIQDVVAQIYEQTRRSADLDLLQKKYPEVYTEIVSASKSDVLRVA